MRIGDKHAYSSCLCAAFTFHDASASPKEKEEGGGKRASPHFERGEAIQRTRDRTARQTRGVTCAALATGAGGNRTGGHFARRRMWRARRARLNIKRGRAKTGEGRELLYRKTGAIPIDHNRGMGGRRKLNIRRGAASALAGGGELCLL